MTEPTRISYDVRRGPKDQLVRELREFSAHRREQGKTERADGADAAADKLADGATRVQFEQTLFVIDDEPGRNGVRRGPKEWVLAELNDGGRGWTELGNRPLAIAHAQAIADIEQGATRVRVGHIEYEVTPDA